MSKGRWAERWGPDGHRLVYVEWRLKDCGCGGTYHDTCGRFNEVEVEPPLDEKPRIRVKAGSSKS